MRVHFKRGIFLQALKQPTLTPDLLCQEAHAFSIAESTHAETVLFGVTDGKAVGTYLEHKFRLYLLEKYEFEQGNSASGIDFPSLQIDMKVTSMKQPQSSCPFKSARQKIYGLGYGLLIFVYDKLDNRETKTGTLYITNTVLVEKDQTADFQMTKGLRQIIENEGNADDLMAFMAEKNLPVDEIELQNLAEELLLRKPEQGYLTISNALQWRLQYARVLEKAGSETGLVSVFRNQ
jgi:hypothetical protein